MSKTRVVIALGGNALQQNGEVTAEAQKAVASQIWRSKSLSYPKSTKLLLHMVMVRRWGTSS